ncbi:hypothetical protein J2X65_003007 [Ancylobacter sp. 3268]|nr:hypothetical protein [Ancylobacter sp. 3268]
MSCCDAAELLELVEEALDAVAFLVEFGVIGPPDPPVSLGRDNDLGTAVSHPAREVTGVVSLVGNGGLRVDALDQVMGAGHGRRSWAQV